MTSGHFVQKSRRREAAFFIGGAFAPKQNNFMEVQSMGFFTSAVTTLQNLVVALGADLAVRESSTFWKDAVFIFAETMEQKMFALSLYIWYKKVKFFIGMN